MKLMLSRPDHLLLSQSDFTMKLNSYTHFDPANFITHSKQLFGKRRVLPIIDRTWKLALANTEPDHFDDIGLLAYPDK